MVCASLGAFAALTIDNANICSGGVWEGKTATGKITERELDCWTCVASWGDEELYIPGLGAGTITPISLHGDTTAADFGTIKILTDQQMIDRFTPKGVSYKKWDIDEGCCYEYETKSDSWDWPYGLWGLSNKANTNRRWIQIPIKASKIWYGSKSFNVALKGTTEVTAQSLKIVPAWNDHDAPGKLPLTYTQHNRGLSIGGSGVQYGFDTYGSVFSAEISNYSKTQNVSGDNVFTLKVPEAGTLVVVSDMGDLDEVAYKKNVKVTGAGISGQTFDYLYEEEFEGMSSENMYKYGITYEDVNIHTIKVSKATTLTFTVKGICELEAVIKFYPSAKRSVFVNAMPGWYIWNNGPSGYVTGTGSYKEGETVTLKAVTASGHKFIGWEWEHGQKPANWDDIRNNQTLSFKVTSAMVGSVTQQKQICIRPMWAVHYAVSGIPSPVNVGTIAGGGMKSQDSKVTLTAKPATGYHFVSWEDDASLPASRSVVAGRVYYGGGSDWYYYGDTRYTAKFAVNKYSITFNANGGTGTMAQLKDIKYTSAVTLTKNAFKRENCVFKGWATSATGAVKYANGASVSKLSDVDGGVVKLYAVWAPATTMTFYVNQNISFKFPTLAGYKASALPAGLKWTSSSAYGSLTGKPTKVQTVSVTFTKGTSKVVVKIVIKKDEVIVNAIPKVAGGSKTVDIDLGVSSYAGKPQSVKVTGLPKGLGFENGHLVGPILFSGTKTITVTIVNASGVKLTKTISLTSTVPKACLGERVYAFSEIIVPSAEFYEYNEESQKDNFAPNALFEVKSNGAATFKTLRGTLTGELKFDDMTMQPYVEMSGEYNDISIAATFEFHADGAYWSAAFDCFRE